MSRIRSSIRAWFFSTSFQPFRNSSWSSSASAVRTMSPPNWTPCMMFLMWCDRAAMVWPTAASLSAWSMAR